MPPGFTARALLEGYWPDAILVVDCELAMSRTDIDVPTLERAPFESLVPSSDTVLIDTPAWVQASTPSLGDTSVNGVYLARLAPSETDARIAAVVRSHVERDAEFRWFVGPGSAPEDLAERLRRAGLVEVGEAVGMSLPVSGEPLALPEGVATHEVGSDEVDAFVRLGMRAWARDAAFGAALARALRRGLEHAPELQRSWIFTSAGEAVGVTTLRLLPARRIGYLQGAAVVPAHRRTGVYRAMLHHRLALLRALAYEHAVVWAREVSSARACVAMGFRPRCRGRFFEWRRAPR